MNSADAEASSDQLFIQELGHGYRADKNLADKALDQLDQHEWHVKLDDESNSVAVLVRHVTGNLRSRWSDFLTTDGEKPDRNRDAEFEAASQSVEQMQEEWDQAFALVERTLAALTPADLQRTITIRGEPQAVIRALLRNYSHTAQHVGQIVMLAKHIRGERWRTLSIPRARGS